MKSIKPICLSLLVLTGTLPCARGEPFRTDINPALLYYQAFLLKYTLSQTDMDYWVTNNWQCGHLPERFGSIVSNYNPELTLMRQASRQKMPCDWGIDMSLLGAATLIPYLASAKHSVVAAQYQIMWDLQNGNQSEARDDLLAALTLGRDVSQNKTLISALVEMAIESVVCMTIAENFHRFSPETLQQLADGFNAAPARGTVAASVPSEKLFHDWVLLRIEDVWKKYPGNNTAAMEEIRQFVGSGNIGSQDKDWEALTNAAGGTVDGVIRLVRDSEPLYVELGSIMALPFGEYESRIQQFSAGAQKSGNPFFLQSLPSWLSCRRKEFSIDVDLAMVRAAIEYKLHGEAGFKSVMDPCGNGLFTMQRFVLDGVDRGFELKSAFDRWPGPEAYIFVETDGPPFNVMGTKVGQPFSQ